MPVCRSTILQIAVAAALALAPRAAHSEPSPSGLRPEVPVTDGARAASTPFVALDTVLGYRL